MGLKGRYFCLKGIELPAVLTNMDPDSGLPAMFEVKEEEMEEWKEEHKVNFIMPLFGRKLEDIHFRRGA